MRPRAAQPVGGTSRGEVSCGGVAPSLGSDASEKAGTVTNHQLEITGVSTPGEYCL